MGIARRFIFATGAAALLGAMTADFAGVLGRAVGWNPLGLVEVVQICVVGAISASLVLATVQGAHAAVRMLTGRLAPPLRRLLERLSDLLGALLFAALTAGSGWMLSDTWPLDERTDVIGIPVAPERVVATIALGIVSLIFLAAAPRPGGEPEERSDDA